ncbi:hypothetical protein [Planctobacterium marinum]|uniref:Rap1a immunity protein domain-containing protein n=1 Tax=Planctobacterium marinum TaxID=1631968 RepID=A0AA48HKN0_9ALTE|nr:hypothetical protein MACH26_41090 [Planctobacterium marinum]
MNKLINVVLLLATATFTVSAQAKSEEEFYKDMNQMCAETNTKSSTVFITSCYQYIRGFLQGAVITDTVIMEQVDKSAFKSSYENRAYRTRVGMERTKTPATLYAGFCLPDDNVTHEVVLHLLKSVQDNFKAADEIPGNPLSEHLYALLKQSYPCKDSTQVSVDRK